MKPSDLLKTIAATLLELAVNRSLPVGELYVLMLSEGFDLDDTLLVVRAGKQAGLWTDRYHLLEPTPRGLELGQGLKDKLLPNEPVKQPLRELN